jgi:8-oxo-dGTP pyrophosphatase MutT (NUDIX family)
MSEPSTPGEERVRAEQMPGQPDHDDAAPVSVGPWVRHSRRIAYENPWIRVLHDEVQRPDGTPGIYGIVQMRNAAVGVVALDADDRVVMVRQHRYALDHLSWEIPEGGVPRGESLIVGAMRELREEAGVEAATWRELGRIHLSNSITDEVGTLFLATELRKVPQALESSEADLVLEWVHFDTALAMVLDGRITDALSVIAIQRVAIERQMTKIASAGATPTDAI